MSEAPYYEKLTELDRSFLIYEGPSSPMHVGSVQIHDAAPLRSAGGAIDFERLVEFVASRLHLLPRYRQRVAKAPLDAHPIWIDDANFNLRYHLRHSRLPRPGDARTLKRSAARILEQPIDLEKPLWELWLVEGLEGDRVALVSKVHHCMVDGVSGVDLMNALMTAEPTEKTEPPGLWRPRRPPTALEYAADELGRRAGAPLRAAEALRRLAADEDGARGELRERLRAVARVASSGARGATPAPFNQPIGPHRRFDWLSTSLDDIARVRQGLGGTVNDVVLAAVAGAMSRWLRKSRQTDVEGLEFKVMTPVSVRAAGERGALGNRVAAWFVPLPLAERDRRRRLQRVREATERLKQRREALGGETITRLIEWLGPAPVTLAARLMREASPFNMVVTNVPGPRTPLYLLGSRMLEGYPLVPLLGTLGLGIALLSYERTLNWGFVADRDLVPDLHDLVLDVEAELAKLRELAERG
jgi:WS/DGAT/MGAT family acyltransferase